MKFKLPNLLQPQEPVNPTPPPKPVNPSRPRPNRKPTTQPAEIDSNDFGKTLESLLGNKFGGTKVSEEELYAALILHQLKQKYGTQYFNDFKATFQLNQVDKPRGEHIEASAERAANDSLKFFVEATFLTQAEANELKQTAFELAQLNDRKDTLWDAYGDTKSVTSFARAQHLMQKRLNALETSSSKTRRVAKAPSFRRVG